MNYSDVHKFWIPARRLFLDNQVGGGNVQTKMTAGSRELAALLGLTYPEAGHYTRIELTDELRRKLELLSGPHGVTFRKILEARGTQDA